MYTYTYVHIDMFIYMYIYICILYIYTYVNIHIYIHRKYLGRKREDLEHMPSVPPVLLGMYMCDVYMTGYLYRKNVYVYVYIFL
jgi:hypothetical protein